MSIGEGIITKNQHNPTLTEYQSFLNQHSKKIIIWTPWRQSRNRKSKFSHKKEKPGNQWVTIESDWEWADGE